MFVISCDINNGKARIGLSLLGHHVIAEVTLAQGKGRNKIKFLPQQPLGVYRVKCVFWITWHIKTRKSNDGSNGSYQQQPNFKRRHVGGMTMQQPTEVLKPVLMPLSAAPNQNRKATRTLKCNKRYNKWHHNK